MSMYYPMAYGYTSKIHDGKMFKTVDEARLYDMRSAAGTLYGMSEDALFEAMTIEIDGSTKRKFDSVATAMRLFVEAYEDNKVRLKKAAEPPPAESAEEEPVDVEVLPAPPRMVGADRGEMGEVIF